MTEERIVETRSPNGQTSTHTTIVTDGAERRRGGGGMLIILVVVALLAIAAFWAMSNIGGAEIAKDNAIADAAGEVGAAAGEVGEAAQEAAGAVAN